MQDNPKKQDIMGEQLADTSQLTGAAPGKPAFLTLLPMFDELRDERIVVRPYREEDAQALYEAIEESRDHLRPWLPFADEHRSVAEAHDWINQQRAKWILRETLGLAVFDASSGRFLGGLGLHPRNWDIRYFEIGYWLRKSAEGHGYMIAAVRLLANWALGSLKAQRIEIRCDAGNTHSANVARRLGFTQEGLLRNDFQSPDGRVRNTLVFSCIPGDGA